MFWNTREADAVIILFGEIPGMRSWLFCLFGSLFLIVPHAASAQVVISEVHWAGSDLSSADEWLELSVVPGSADTDIGGWVLTSLSGGEEKEMIQFEAGLIVSAHTPFVVANYSAADSHLAEEADLVSTAVSLSNSRLLLRLYDAEGNLVDTVDDGSGAPFAGLNDAGVYASMERVNLTLPGTDASNWVTATRQVGIDAGATVYGTPGYAHEPEVSSSSSLSFQSSAVSSVVSSVSSGISESSASSFSSSSSQDSSAFSSVSSISSINLNLPQVKISELLPDPAGSDDGEWIELWNPTQEPVNIAGWSVRVGSTETEIPGEESGARWIGPQSYVLLHRSEVPFSLRNGGNDVALLAGGNVVDQLTYPSLGSDVSYGLLPGSAENRGVLCTLTPGITNAASEPTVEILIQSGPLRDEAPLSLNLDAEFSGDVECLWDFTDATIDESCNPSSHTFTDPGTYMVSLQVTDACGSVASDTLRVEVLQTPSAGSAKKGIEHAGECVPQTVDQIVVSEFLPNPVGDDEEEWIELQNLDNRAYALCGWSLDDVQGGSSAFVLNDYVIPAEGFLLLPRSETKIALNNNVEEVRLFAPGQETPAQSVPYRNAEEGESYARQDDGSFAWTTLPTPSAKNTPQEIQQKEPVLVDEPTETRSILLDWRSLAAGLSITEVYPSANTGEEEWIEVRNTSPQSVSLEDWVLDDIHDAGSKPWVIPTDTTVPGSGYLVLKDFPVSLNNGGDEVWLTAPDGSLSVGFRYESVKKGWSVVANGFPLDPSQQCMSDEPTPGSSGECTKNVINKNASLKGSLENSAGSSYTESEELRSRYINVGQALESSEEGQILASPLLGFLHQQRTTQGNTSQSSSWEIFSIGLLAGTGMMGVVQRTWRRKIPSGAKKENLVQ